jgi:hypothetical protein
LSHSSCIPKRNQKFTFLSRNRKSDGGSVGVEAGKSKKLTRSRGSGEKLSHCTCIPEEGAEIHIPFQKSKVRLRRRDT